MANSEHLKRIKEDLSSWNRWRERNKEVEPDLSEASLNFINLAGINLDHADLSKANLSNSDLRGANLKAAKLNGANLGNTYLKEATLEKAQLRGAYLEEANLSGADLKEADLNQADLKKASLDNTNLSKAILRRTNLRNVNLSGCNLSGADLYEADLTKANLMETYLGNANLKGAFLEEIILEQAKLYGANLSGTNLRGANLKKANLKGADLSHSILADAALTGADLSGADLYKADLRGVNFDGAHLVGASLTRSDLRRAKLRRADLKGANLKEALLSETNFYGADLSACRVYGVLPWNLNLKETIQKDLVITPDDEVTITTDSLEMAQFIHLLLHNQKIYNVIHHITSRVVFIIGRFPEKRAVLSTALREELRKHDYWPVMFDFDKPVSKDPTQTISTLAQMARFVIADLSGIRSINQVLKIIIPRLPGVPVQPLILQSLYQDGMFLDCQKYPSVMPAQIYNNEEELISELNEKIIAPNETKARKLNLDKETIGIQEPGARSQEKRKLKKAIME